MRLVYLTLPAVMFLVGCAGEKPTGPVSGRVTLAGKPVTAGRVTFVAKDQSATASAELTPEGTYSLTDAPTGEVTVAVRTKDHATLPVQAVATGKRGSADHAPAQAKNPLYVPVPPRYEDLSSSGLTVTIPKSGGKPFVYDIELTR